MTHQPADTCRHCHQLLTRRRAWQKFCSADCRRGYNRAALQKEAAEALEIVEAIEGRLGRAWLKALKDTLCKAA